MAFRALSLHRLIALGAGLLSTAIVLSMAAVALVTSRATTRMQEATEQVVAEQASAERVVRQVQDQVMLAGYFVRDPNDELVRRFRDRGDQAFVTLRGYLYRDLPAAERTEVERLKAIHQELETTALLVFDLVRRGERENANRVTARMVEQSLALHDEIDRLVVLQNGRLERLKADQQGARADMNMAMLLLGAASLTVVVLLAGALRRRLLQPLHELSLAAARLGAGDLGARVPPARQRELGAVTESFNGMADRLQDARGELETRNLELAEAVETLRRTQQEVVQAEKMTALGGMLAGLAHELNNPLASVLGYAEMLRERIREAPDGPGTAAAAELAEPIVAEALRARELVRGMLQFSRTAGSALGGVSLGDALAVVVGLRRYSFAQADLVLETELEPDLWVVGEDQRLQQVLLNLVNNAYDALAGGGGTALTITASASPEWVEVSVRDDGPGLAEPTRVFDPFYTTKPVGAGTGLGLSLVHRMVSEFGGSVEAFNAPEGGACIVLRLLRARPPVPEASAPAPGPASGAVRGPDTDREHPVLAGGRPPRTGHAAAIRSRYDAAPRTALVPEPMACRDPGSGASPGPTLGESPGERRQRVLVVDDEESLRHLQRRTLGRMGLEVLLAATGGEAEAVLRSEAVDMVISDVKMPGALSGVDLFRWVSRELPELAERFVFITGDVHEPSIAALAAAEPERFLAKPFQADEYMRHISRVLARHP
jgi:signal transduction histidine kinase/ActR/RegA family two-component response regulator